MLRLYAEIGIGAVRDFAESFAVGRLERDGAKENDHDQIESPDFVGLSKAIDASHLAFLIGIR